MDDLGVPLFSEGCLGQHGDVLVNLGFVFFFGDVDTGLWGCFVQLGICLFWAINVDTGLFFPWDS